MHCPAHVTVISKHDALLESAMLCPQTMAYLLPVLSKAIQRAEAEYESLSAAGRAHQAGALQALVVAPSRELAMQIVRVAQSLLPDRARGCVQQCIGGANPNRQVCWTACIGFLCSSCWRARPPRGACIPSAAHFQFYLGQHGSSSGAARIIICLHVLQISVNPRHPGLGCQRPALKKRGCQSVWFHSQSNAQLGHRRIYTPSTVPVHILHS